MNRDNHPTDFNKEEYTFLKNGDIADVNGNGHAIIQNEPSNILCSDFKPGFIVIGNKYNITSNNTYYFLVNPQTGCSEIGYIPLQLENNGLTPIENSCGCDVTSEEGTPLEQITQTPNCTYFTLLSDYCQSLGTCTGCLNFDVNHPIKENNIEIKTEVTGTVIYWTDNFNPPRYLNISDIASYFVDVNDCEGTQTPTCLQCDKLKIFKDFETPCSTVSQIVVGGNLRAGMYETVIAYSTREGDEISDFYALTNPTPIHDKTNNILDQTNLDYQTPFGIKIDISSLDQSYEYYKLIVIYRNGLDGSVSYFDYGVYPISTTSITITSIIDKVGNNLQNLLSRRPKYLQTKGLTAANGQLFHYGLKQRPEVNLQPVVSLMGSLARWMTYKADESIYQDGVFVANYKSQLRDETYPYGIVFEDNTGFETALFPFVARPPKPEELYVLGSPQFPADTNTASILDNAPVCADIDRNKYWQFFNTAEVEDTCLIPAGSGVTEDTIVQDTTAECVVLSEGGNVQVVDTILSSSFTNDTPITDLDTWVNTNAAYIISTTGTNLNDIRDILSSPSSYTQHCKPEFPDSCSTPTLVSEHIFAINAEEVTSEKNYTPYEDLTRPTPPTSCTTLELDSFGNPVNNTAFVAAYMDPTDVVYKRIASPTNSSCATSTTISELTSPQIQNTNYLLPYGDTVSPTNLLTTINVLTTAPGFNNKLHVGAIWFKGQFNGESQISVELTPTLCNNSDDATGTKIRLSFYKSCSDTTSLTIYDKIITDATLPNDPNKFVTLQASDFPSGTFYMAVDAQITSKFLATSATTYLVTPPCGCFSVYTHPVSYNYLISYENLTFGKKEVYESSCTFLVPNFNRCNPVPDKYGWFSYTESTDTYPCNPELWDSSSLVIEPTDIPSTYQSEFESYYTSGLDSNGNYVLTAETNFQNKGIRHYKFPDSNTAPFMSEEANKPGNFLNSTIYPIGFWISNDVINSFLDIAVKNKLISFEDRNKITGYKIYRGDRRTDKSIVAKGFLFDVYRYTDGNTNSTVYYPNYPLNALGSDRKNDVLIHPFNNTGNNVYTFHSPETSFNRSGSLARELSIEGYVMGKAGVYFDEVRDHATFTLLGIQATSLASILAYTEITLEILLQTTDFLVTANSGGAQPLTVAAVVLAAATGVVLAVQGLYKAGQYRYQWLQTFHQLGKPNNFAYYSAAVGFYNYFKGNSVSTSLLRGINTITYTNSGRLEIPNELNNDTINLNNFGREESVFINLGASAYKTTYPSFYQTYDTEVTSPNTCTRTGYAFKGRSGKIVRNTGLPYVAVKTYVPNQYGTINSVQWINTGYCGNLYESNDCNPAFGGDTFITRWAFKRKFPFFTTTAHKLAPLIPFKYSDYFNINPTSLSSSRYYVDHLISDNTFTAGTFLFPDLNSKYNLDFDIFGLTGFYVNLPAKFYLYSYGFPHALVESSYNCEYRYAKKERHENFYPNIQDVIEYTQESNVSIREREEFFYNTVYSAEHTKDGYRLLPTDYKQELQNKIASTPNTIAWSRIDSSENSLTDPWLTYRADDYFQFPSENGKLISVDSIESEQLLIRFENGYTISNSVDPLAERTDQSNYKLGTGGIFNNRNLSFNKTPLGYAGSQNSTKLSTSYGHFWADAKRGKVYVVAPNAKDFKELSKGLSAWLQEHLPFKILKYFPEVDVDNNYTGIGLSMGWDERKKRVFLTKKDYVPVGDVCYSNGVFYDMSGLDELSTAQESFGRVFLRVEDCKAIFQSGEKEFQASLPVANLQDKTLFEDVSWTAAYSPITDSWISYYDFKPNFYTSYNEFFQTGISDSTGSTVWNHYPHTSSYGVFYGTFYPFVVEYLLNSNLLIGNTVDITYWLETKKLYNNYDFADISNKGFTRGWVYNAHQNTGDLVFISSQPNNRFQRLQYPKHVNGQTEILQTETHNKYSFNYLFNNIRNENSGLPVWNADRNDIDKVINPTLLDYRNTQKDRLRGDYFFVRLQQDVESRYKMIFRYATETRNYKQ